MIEVAAAIIYKNGKFLICQRPKGKALEYLWEFPGGKIEPGETAEKCLIRECQEELGVTIGNIVRLDEITYPYPDFKVQLTFFKAEIAHGEIKNIEHDELAWITYQDIHIYEFCPADVMALNRNPEWFNNTQKYLK